MDWLSNLSANRIDFDLLSEFLIPIVVGLIAAFVFAQAHLKITRRSLASALNPFYGYPVFILVMTTLFCLLQFSLALSLGVIGSLSLVRFRLAVKTFLDLSCVLISVAISLLCATRSYGALIVFLGVAAVVFWIFHLTSTEKKVELGSSLILLQFQGTPGDSRGVISEIRRQFGAETLKDIKVTQTGASLSLLVTSTRFDEALDLVTKYPTMSMMAHSRNEVLAY